MSNGCACESAPARTASGHFVIAPAHRDREMSHGRPFSGRNRNGCLWPNPAIPTHSFAQPPSRHDCGFAMTHQSAGGVLRAARLGAYVGSGSGLRCTRPADDRAKPAAANGQPPSQSRRQRERGRARQPEGPRTLRRAAALRLLARVARHRCVAPPCIASGGFCGASARATDIDSVRSRRRRRGTRAQ